MCFGYFSFVRLFHIMTENFQFQINLFPDTMYSLQLDLFKIKLALQKKRKKGNFSIVSSAKMHFMQPGTSYVTSVSAVIRLCIKAVNK